MTFQVMLAEKLKGLLTTIIAVWAVSILALTTLDEVESRQNQKVISKLTEESFEDYVIYHSIKPVLEEVDYGSEARYVSDMEVLKGGFRIQWREFIECDYNPNDGKEVFEYYKAAQDTGRYFSEPVPRRSLDDRLGFPVRSQTGQVIEYPNRDADCRLVSSMTQEHEHDVRKHMIMNGEIVKVRRLK